ncbi:hypothetical protein BEWA_018040 [Theileria equi strain WA]|uniref:ENTH domain-containing protein n=1 Tax=Theileria equi strain WA TaxID=1537102 RepID=L0AUR1_THEEQ|nr:hypothetical protein BEWA_018040 [Theileria equi strain WA]AFZ78963.1 hypothetical protein BEWA_018040 [Theileria equi strain WA]|eukprot:XP_004828629.1 hypothetical protein BEWA_018040 [Theileria equi strain WA]
MMYNDGLTSLTLQQRDLLSRLTSASSDPVPGYLYNEIIELIKSDISLLGIVQDYCINKLSRKEPYIKYKCLKLLKHLCNQLPNDFIRSKVTQSQVLLQCRGYKAQFSEYNGDYLSKLIRTEVEDLIKVVCSYDSSFDSNNSIAVDTMKDRIIGFGNSGHSNASNNGFHSQPSIDYQQSSKMVGFGNQVAPDTSYSMFSRNGTLKMLSEVANKYLSSEIVEKIEKVGSAITTTAMEQIEKHIGYGSADRKFSPSIPQHSYHNVAPRINTYGTHIDHKIPILSTDDNSLVASDEKYHIPGEEEVKFAKEMISFTGIKISPSPQLIEEFIKKMDTMDKQVIVDELLKHLNSRSNKWQTHFRILSILESFLIKGILSQRIVDGFKSTAIPIFDKCKLESQLHNKATKLVNLICDYTGPSYDMETSAKSVKQSQSIPSDEISNDLDLLSFDRSAKEKHKPTTEDIDLFNLNTPANIAHTTANNLGEKETNTVDDPFSFLGDTLKGYTKPSHQIDLL